MDNLRAELQQSQNAELEEGRRTTRASRMSVDSLEVEVNAVVYIRNLH